MGTYTFRISLEDLEGTLGAANEIVNSRGWRERRPCVMLEQDDHLKSICTVYPSVGQGIDEWAFLSLDKREEKKIEE